MNKIVGIAAIVLALGSFGLFLFSPSDVAYVELNTVYAEFNYSKELLAKHEATNRLVIQEKDSLSRLLNSLITEKDQYNDSAGVVTYYLRALNERVQNLESILDQDKQQINEKIANQINKKMEEFGKKNNYKVILGAKGDGTLMYAANKVNLTQKFLEFINKPE